MKRISKPLIAASGAIILFALEYCAYVVAKLYGTLDFFFLLILPLLIVIVSGSYFTYAICRVAFWRRWPLHWLIGILGAVTGGGLVCCLERCCDQFIPGDWGNGSLIFFDVFCIGPASIFGVVPAYLVVRYSRRKLAKRTS